MHTVIIKNLSSIVLLLLVSCSSAPESTTSSSGEGQPFLTMELLPALKESLPPPPQNQLAQGGEVKELFSLQKSRKKKDCERAALEVEPALGNFFGPPHGPLTAQQVAQLDPFFVDIRHSSGPFIGKLKGVHVRKRPFEVIKGLKPCVKQETSLSYPSGHGLFAEIYALVLTDLFPNLKDKIQTRADTVAKDRVLSGVHYPSDVSAGRVMGQKIYAEMVKSEKYQEAFKTAKGRVSNK